MPTKDLSTEQKMKLANDRAKELKTTIQDYLDVRETIPSGFEQQKKIEDRKQKILRILGATKKNWNNWKWQIRNRITSVEGLEKLLNIPEQEKETILEVEKKYRWAISPYYLSLIDPDNPDDPVRKQCIPTIAEIVNVQGEDDPMGEGFTSPVPYITRRYPDRLIINVTNQCGMYCRHCQRRRNIGEEDVGTPKKDLERTVNYIHKHEEIRDVLLTGGDAFMLSNQLIEWLLTKLRSIPHVEIIRFGTRTPVTLPQRITPELCEILEKYHPVFVNTHFNHPQEITEEAAKACNLLSRAGVPLGNQSVLLSGVNNNKHIMKKLNQELLKIRVLPYYIFHAKNVSGTTHFNVKVEDGLEIMENLRGYTSGLAIPTYIINAPKGHGKTPILPNYLISHGKNEIKIRTWEGRCFDYPNDGPEKNEEN